MAHRKIARKSRKGVTVPLGHSLNFAQKLVILHVMQEVEAKLSLVIPVYNRAALVDRLLSTFSSHDMLPAHIVLVDNNSTDNSLAVLNSYRDRIATEVTVVACTRRGAAAARNAGLALVTTPWVMFFDSDDEIGTHHFANILHAISANPTADIIGWNCPDGHGLRRFYATDCQRRNLYNGCMATQRWVARTELVRSAGAWDENVGYWDDIELGSRMLAMTDKVVHAGTADVFLNNNEDSITGAGMRDFSAADEALRRMEATLSEIWGAEKAKFRVALKKVIEYANLTRSNPDEKSRNVIDKLLVSTLLQFSRYPRTLLYAANRYRQAGGRGAWMASFFY